MITAPDLVGAAVSYHARGWYCVPLDGKRPLEAGWQHSRIDPRAEPGRFRQGSGIGVLLGASGLVDLEADCAGADLALEHLAPPTDCVYRSPTSRAHRLYCCVRGEHRAWRSVDGGGLVEIRAGAHQSVLPPSPHPDGGSYRWVHDGEPAPVEPEPLRRAAVLAAVAGGLGSRWSRLHGSRQHAALALAGYLRRCGIPRGDAESVLRAICRAGQDEEATKRLAALRDTYAQPAEEHATGLPTLARMIGESESGWLADTLAEISPRVQAIPLRVDAPHGASVARPRIIAPPHEPLPNARLFARERYCTGGQRTLHHHREAFWAWDEGAYRECEDARLRTELYEWLDGASYLDEKGRAVPTHPTRSRVDTLLDALRAVCYLPASVRPPAWLTGAGAYPAGELIACRNGALHVPSRQVLPAQPGLFCTWALDYDADPSAADPAEWLAFLRDLWGDDQEAIDALQEAMGYTLTPDTSLQKAFMLVGPPRAGKGTITRVWRRLVGAENVAGPTLNGLATNFGLAPLIDKPLAIISDARLSGRADQQAVVERLLAVTGEDALTVDRKHRDAWTGQVPARIVLVGNELPRLGDTSGALASRFIILRLTRSWLGREDPALTDRLLPELPGILLWALNGLDRLRTRKRFLQPASGAEMAGVLAELSSPTAAFVRECCELQSLAETPVDDLYSAWRSWCAANGRDNPGTKQGFSRDLLAAVPQIRCARRGHGGTRKVYAGLRLIDHQQDE